MNMAGSLPKNLGEYAAHIPGRRLNIETALSEAIYLTALERNADVVTMTSYAPLLAKEKHTNWNPDLIYFNNTEVKLTVDYYVQQMFGTNSGTVYIPSEVSLSDQNKEVKERVGISIVKDETTGDLIVKMANLLPRTVTAAFDWGGMDAEGEAALTVLSGAPTNEEATPVSTTLQVTKDYQYVMPAYSFSVLRIQK
jgi:alpha-L-arabinofuranosidase